VPLVQCGMREFTSNNKAVPLPFIAIIIIIMANLFKKLTNKYTKIRIFMFLFFSLYAVTACLLK